MAVHRFARAIGPDWIMEVGRDRAGYRQRHSSKEGKRCDYQTNEYDPDDNPGTILSHGITILPTGPPNPCPDSNCNGAQNTALVQFD